MRGLILLTLGIFTLGCERPLSPFPSGAIIDLSHPFDEHTIFWPTAAPFRLDKVADGLTEKGYYYAANQFCAAEHGGTHIDASVHFAQGGKTVDQIRLDQLLATGVLVDVTRQSAADRDYQITVADLQAWESAHGGIPAGSILLFRTGYGRYWPDRVRYLGTAARGEAAVPLLHFPGLHPDAARWLAVSRSVKAVGLDTASIDFGQSTLFESHRALMAHDIPAFENLANLDALPAVGFSVIALPMKIGGGSGGPLRAVALVPE